jgi:hypothetical protein
MHACKVSKSDRGEEAKEEEPKTRRRASKNRGLPNAEHLLT